MSRMRKSVMILLAVVNLLSGIGVFLFGHLGYGIAESVSYSRFRELQLHLAIEIDRAALPQISNAGLSDPSDVHRFLTEGFRDELTIFNFAAIGLAINAGAWTFAAMKRSSSSSDR